ncbi:LysR family transcriptional regulator [Curtobacterium sp. PhB136]|uniref:LysR family transcriptional regulator n=1 Tax=Curtobacterium sp. PhB136 TaxID=2485181 RepID=UPI0010E8636C|nr:LysR family transcriptional regulator [Curtobacterium sp. PhB136]TCK62899.1 LysR family transcriptional regulator [Curtobacterium sp. PhB136]
MQLDLNLLTALEALLEAESVTGAADRLHLSAPAMSRTLGRIRRATGDEILVRAGREMRPTPRAIAMREEVRSLVLRSRDVLAPETGLDLATLERTFTIRAHDALVTVLAPALVQRVAADAPGVVLRFLGEAPDDTTDLQRGVVDLEIGSEVHTAPAIDHETVTDDALVGLARRGHPLFDDEITLAAWLATPHVVVSRRGRLRDRVDRATGDTRSVIASVASTSAAIEIVRATDAVVVVPASVATRAASAGDTVEVFTPPVDLPSVAVVLTWHRRFTTDRGHAWLRSLVARTLRRGTGSTNEAPTPDHDGPTLPS